LKLAWIVAGGPPALRTEALASLELIADSFLSVGTPVQAAARELLVRAAPVRAAIQQRVRDNFAELGKNAADFAACTVLPVEGGWSAVIRIPETCGEEQFVLELLDTERILVHPGYFFDFPREAYIVVSLLVEPRLFSDAVSRVLHAAVQ
jgi:aspartate/methionine/tyrosine aminotransferase